MELKNKKVLVVGSGISGIAATKILGKNNARVTLLDGNKKLNKETILNQIPEDIKADVIIGELTKDEMEAFDAVVLSPGVPTDLPFVNELRDMGKPILGEIELAYLFEKGSVVAITGTNGKTTTTALTGQILKAYNEKTFVVGNIGLPYTSMVPETSEDSFTVAEVSSFQLETVDTFRPKVSAILNLSPDHLNRHHTMEAYVQAKLNVTKNQTEEDTCVLNYEDETLREFGKTLNCKVVFFSSERVLENGMYYKDEVIYHAVNGVSEAICNVNDLKILGKHNFENVMAAVAMAMAMGVDQDTIYQSITSFIAVEHRIEYVDEIDGVRYYNDSKGTNPDAAIKGIQAMNRKTVLIGGGYNKDSTYDEWIQAFDGKVTYLILLGQTKELIAECAKKNGFTDIIFVDSLKEAVEKAASLAKPGESVLLSPACASWGMFKNYEERGEQFKEFVMEMKK
ncbi:MAG: UDP-N-acetylmuramoyl-L-alanine--D-glutamate ligase [bacterium]|nr:UDP-N-acetylmuramoyl-L-alanine--D-glutamate ligase [bacterium]